MTTTIAIANRKGGVGKTTTCASLGVAFAQKRQRVLMVDLDPQANLTSSFGLDADGLPQTVGSVLESGGDANEAILALPQTSNLHLLPSSSALAVTEIILQQKPGGIMGLKGLLKTVKKDYDYVLLDTPPSLGLLTGAALAAADQLLIPTRPDVLGFQSVEKVRELLNDLTEGEVNPKLKLRGVVLTFHQKQLKLTQVVQTELIKAGYPVLKVVIPQRVAVAEAPGMHQPILLTDPKNDAAIAYKKLAAEIAA